MTELERRMNEAWNYWRELSEDGSTPKEDMHCAARDYYTKQRAYDDARHGYIENMSNTSVADLGRPIPLNEHLLRVARSPSLDPYPPRKQPPKGNLA